MKELIKAFQEYDSQISPSTIEVVLGYAGFHAVMWHRLSHKIYKSGLKTLARGVSQFARFLTGIEIHPAATIGKRLVIDHGMGVVIGETAIIGDDVNLFHGVTLGGTGGVTKGAKRHPTVEDGAMIGANASILGDITIGKNAKIGANSVVLCDVAENATVIGIPAREYKAKKGATYAYGLPCGQNIDPFEEELEGLRHKLENLSKDIKKGDQKIRDPEDWQGSGI